MTRKPAEQTQSVRISRLLWTRLAARVCPERLGTRQRVHGVRETIERLIAEYLERDNDRV